MDEPARLDRHLIAVDGPEAIGFLDNLLTQNLQRLGDPGVLYAALLSPQGKLITDMFVWRREGGVLLDVDPSRAEDLFRRLTMYKLRAPVTITDASTKYDVIVSPKPFNGAERDPRQEALGWRALVPKGASQPQNVRYSKMMLAAGAPDLAHDAAPEEVFALEALLEELNGVDFQKGCFVGQENVSRMKRRATTRKKFCPIAFEGEALPFGTVIRAGEAELGQVRSGDDGRAIALVRLDRALEALAEGRSLSAGGRDIRLDPPPWLTLPQREATDPGARD